MSAWSKDGLDRLDELVARHVAADGVPGAAWLVARDGEVHVGTAGTIDGSKPVQRDSIFRIASMTKPVTAAAVLALAEDCVLRLDDPLDRWLPELADRKVMVDPRGSVDDTVPAVRQPTVHDALTFRLGWGMDFADWEGQTLPGAMAAAMGLEVGPPQPSKTPPPDEFVAVLGRFPLEHQPGEKWLYNMGSDVLGVVVERAAGKRFGDVLQERIFGPLGMRDTAFHVPAASMGRFGPSYLPSAWAPEPGAMFDPTDGGWAARPAFESGAGGLVSTLDDYLAFAQALLDGGGPILFALVGGGDDHRPALRRRRLAAGRPRPHRRPRLGLRRGRRATQDAHRRVPRHLLVDGWHGHVVGQRSGRGVGGHPVDQPALQRSVATADPPGLLDEHLHHALPSRDRRALVEQSQAWVQSQHLSCECPRPRHAWVYPARFVEGVGMTEKGQVVMKAPSTVRCDFSKSAPRHFLYPGIAAPLAEEPRHGYRWSMRFSGSASGRSTAKRLQGPGQPGEGADALRSWHTPPTAGATRQVYAVTDAGFEALARWMQVVSETNGRSQCRPQALRRRARRAR